jgi:dihydroflavonol-4-reductase
VTVLVTGATGHLGSNVVRSLLARGRRVRALVRGDATALDGLPLEKARGDVLDRRSLDAALDEVEVVYHLAAHVSIYPADGARMLHTNVVGARNVAEACLEHRVRRLVHFSSVHALLPSRDAVTDETRPPNLDSGAPAYDRSKALGEQEVGKVVERGLDAVIVNPTGVIGPFDFHPHLAGRALINIYLGAIPSLAAGGFNWVDSRDVADGALAAEEKGRTGERYLLSGHWRSIPQIAGIIRDRLGRAVPRFVSPIWLARLGLPFLTAWAKLTKTPPMYTRPSLRALGEHRHCDNSRARRELGYHPRPTDHTVVDAFAFYERVGLLRREAVKGEPSRLRTHDEIAARPSHALHGDPERRDRGRDAAEPQVGS